MSSQTAFKTAGATSKHCDLSLVQKASATSPGDPLTGLAYNTSGLTAYYRLGATGTLTSITLATQTVTGAYSSGGFVEIDSTHAPGGYRFDIPNACIASVGECNIWFTGAANLETHQLKIIITGADLFDGVRLGLSSLLNLAAPTGIAQAGANQTITLANGTTAAQMPPGSIVAIISGTGAGQAGKIASVSGAGGATPIATMHDVWPVANPDNTSVYQIFASDGVVPAAPADVWTQATRTLTAPLVGGRLDTNVGSVAGVAVQQNGSGTQQIGGP